MTPHLVGVVAVLLVVGYLVYRTELRPLELPDGTKVRAGDVDEVSGGVNVTQRDGTRVHYQAARVVGDTVAQGSQRIGITGPSAPARSRIGVVRRLPGSVGVPAGDPLFAHGVWGYTDALGRFHGSSAPKGAFPRDGFGGQINFERAQFAAAELRRVFPLQPSPIYGAAPVPY